MEGLLVAVQFLTRIRIRADLLPDAKTLGRSTSWFPLVGFLIGLILWGGHKLLSTLLPQATVNVLLILALTAISGGIHADGFCDAVEGLYAGRSKEEVLRIMKDPCIGSIGALSLFFLLSLKIAFLAAIPKTAKGSVLLIAPMLGRWIMVFLVATGKYARREGGIGQVFFANTSLRQFAWASIFPLLVMLLLFPCWWGLLLLGFILALNYGLSRWVEARIGGLCGDILGALNEVTELSVFIVAAISIRLGLRLPF
ncbi:MAG: adenosylcobinamide-GDP ribazoletransferase [bacterium]|nr:adenosylcobinamide-GDP ribazoletransferase [bacterium]